MTSRELVILGTAGQSPTRYRHHNGYLLRWDGDAVLFDPGEGAQRQLTMAGVSPASIGRICITHFHGDHCLGLPGVILRIGLDKGHLPVPVHYPAGGEVFLRRLSTASEGQELDDIDPRPVHDAGEVHVEDGFRLECARLAHPVETIGWRLSEPDGRTMRPDLLAAAGVRGPDVGRLRDEGSIDVDGRRVTLEEMSEHRAGQSFAFVMDTSWCDAALELADGVDLLVCESTFLSAESELAAEHGHLTARQAGQLAAEAGARRLVLSHFSGRHTDSEAFAEEARQEFGDVVIAEELARVPVPQRRHAT